MGQYASNIDLFPVEMNGRNQAILVTANIEDDKTIHIICTREMLFQLAKSVVIRLADNVIPVFQRRLAIGILRNKLSDSLMCDDVHILLYLIPR